MAPAPPSSVHPGRTNGSTSRLSPFGSLFQKVGSIPSWHRPEPPPGRRPPLRVHCRRSPRPPEVAMRVLPLRKRRWVLLVAAPVVAVIIVAVLAAVRLWWFRPAPRFGPATFERIKEGMTEDEVEAVVGCPAGYYNKPPPRPAGLPPDASLPTG